MFETYLRLGFGHILDAAGLDHILFIISICLSANATRFRNIFILATAFTLGHSITLALSALDVVSISPNLVETLIPITIILTCLHNIYNSNGKSYLGLDYFLVSFFGLIHGLGFSNFFKSILGKEDSIVVPLLSFNIGVELAQLLIVMLIMFLIFLLKKLNVKVRIINIIGSLLIILWALKIIFI